MPFSLISSLYDLRDFAGLGLPEASANSRDAVNIRVGCCRPLRRVVPAIAKRNIDDGGKRHAAQLVGWYLGVKGFGVDFVANFHDMAGVVVDMRDCICEKRAPSTGPCQAFAERASGPRMARDW